MKYRYKSTDNAVKRIKQLELHIEQLEEIATRLKNETIILAKLAATGPTFFNPLEAFAAEEIRNRILRDNCFLNPDGSFIKKSEGAA